MRHADKIGEWVVVDGVRNSYRGKLLRVEEHPPDAVLFFSPCYALQALADTDGEVLIESSPEHPVELYAAGVLTLSVQNKTWPRK